MSTLDDFEDIPNIVDNDFASIEPPYCELTVITNTNLSSKEIDELCKRFKVKSFKVSERHYKTEYELDDVDLDLISLPYSIVEKIVAMEIKTDLMLNWSYSEQNHDRKYVPHLLFPSQNYIRNQFYKGLNLKDAYGHKIYYNLGRIFPLISNFPRVLSLHKDFLESIASIFIFNIKPLKEVGRGKFAIASDKAVWERAISKQIDKDTPVISFGMPIFPYIEKEVSEVNKEIKECADKKGRIRYYSFQVCSDVDMINNIHICWVDDSEDNFGIEEYYRPYKFFAFLE